MNYEIAVIGGGPAGITLAKILGKKKKTVIIRPEDHSMIYCAMPYAIEGLLETGKTLKSDSLVTDAGADLLRKTVKEIDYEGKTLWFDDGESLSYEKLILATGAEPLIPPIPGAELRGVSGFKTEDDLKTLLALIEQGLRKAVVVGAGAIGMELAQALAEKGLQVDLVDLGGSVLPNLVDPEMTEDLEAEMVRRGIRLHLNTRVTGLKGQDWVEAVELDNGSTLAFLPRNGSKEGDGPTHDGLVIFAVGMRPSLDLVVGRGFDLGKDGIIINDRMETSRDDVFAAGDCTQFISGITGKAVPGKLATNAVPMAKVLGYRLLGQARRYPGFFNGAATRVGPFFAGGTGLTETAAAREGFEVITGTAEVTTRFPIMPEAKKMVVKLVADRKSHRLLGAQIISGEPVTGQIDLLTFAIQKESTVEDMTSLSYSSQPYQSFYPAGNGVVMAAEKILTGL